MARKSNPDKELKSPQLGAVLTKKLAELDTNALQFSGQIEFAYDHIRKVCKGEVFPGAAVLVAICKKMKLDYDEMMALVEDDKARLKGWVKNKTKSDPILSKLIQHWQYLTPKDKQEMLEIVRIKAERSLQSGRR